jgi:hypothetical protein
MVTGTSLKTVTPMLWMSAMSSSDMQATRTLTQRMDGTEYRGPLKMG